MKAFVFAGTGCLLAFAPLCAAAEGEAWFGAPIPESGYDERIPDCGMTAAKVFDAPIPGLERIGTLAVPKSADLPESSTGSIGFECLDRGLFDPDRCYDTLAAAFEVPCKDDFATFDISEEYRTVWYLVEND